ncbi:hypothetical protein Moror_3721 [Moniliophthora roreri MCA 2997]|uniref:Uncharacterized protein n=2 Tax=Moniliophthora roreri TaxID=221103 RepID=V2WMD3_MONRO|nr:hypothetical protein Moror_3721 [Moniliophthora roreri MCA 2997]
MQRLQYDPALEPRPDFNHDCHLDVRNALIASEALPDITTLEQAAQHLLNAWQTGNEERRALWQQQTAADRETEDQRRQQEIEDAQLKAEEEKKQEEETLKEKEKKRAKLHPIDPNKGIDRLLERLHPYARAKLQNCEFVPLWYCLPEATKEAFDNARKLTEETEFSLTKDSNSTLSVKVVDSAKPSPNARPDLSLSWTDIS